MKNYHQIVRAERVIVRRVILDALKAGFELNVNNGGDENELPKRTIKPKEIFDAMFAADHDNLLLFKDKKVVGRVCFVYGNSGWDVISDYTVNLEELLWGANELSERICTKLGF